MPANRGAWQRASSSLSIFIFFDFWERWLHLFGDVYTDSSEILSGSGGLACNVLHAGPRGECGLDCFAAKLRLVTKFDVMPKATWRVMECLLRQQRNIFRTQASIASLPVVKIRS